MHVVHTLLSGLYVMDFIFSNQAFVNTFLYLIYLIYYPLFDIFELRSGNLIKNKISNSKFGNLTFYKFFPKFIFKFKNINFSLNKNSFKTLYHLNFQTHLKSFIFNFSKFAFTYVSCYKKKHFNKRKKQLNFFSLIVFNILVISFF